MKNFCDFCECDNCKFGSTNYELLHAQTEHGDWICETCFDFDLCTDGNKNGPCENEDCVHRPKLISEWMK